MPTSSVHRVLLGWTSVGIGVACSSAVLLAGVAFGFERMYENKIFPGVQIARVRLDGLTKSEARQTLEKAIDAALANGLPFLYHGKDVTLDAVTVSIDPDASRDRIQYSIDAALEAAFAFGRTGGTLARFVTQSRLRIAPVNISPEIRIDRDAVIDALHIAYRTELERPMDAHFALDTTTVTPTVRIVHERAGVEIDAESVVRELEKHADRLEFPRLTFHDEQRMPRITRADILPLLPEAESFAARPKITLKYDGTIYTLQPTVEWISVTGTPGAYAIAIDPHVFADSVKQHAGEIETEAKNGSLVIKDGKLDSFVAGTEGIAIDTDAILARVSAEWPVSSTFPLIVTKTHGTLLGEDPEKLGVKELLGVGISQFSGSPVNRRKNIAHGVLLVNGSLIAPGDTFSLLKTLGSVDEKHHWLPELVIKGNETKPEFGGGLCQIGTTTFRSALAAGLPIVERKNHSYRVRYYEPAGTDATIYEPKPDMRFLNDTGHHILINAYTKGDAVFFEFWGTKDGRVIEQTRPVISHIVKPPPLRMIETLGLAPGKKKCTETAHAGANASFNYTVTYANAEVKKETFRSHYRPWQAVCLIGVEKLTTSSTAASDLPSVESSTP
ncbi:MAG: VanW family protein [Patescibacteria group bacterium]